MPDYEIIAEDTLTSTAASIDLTSIPATFAHLELIISARSTKAAASTDGGEITLNGLTSSIYQSAGIYSINSSTPSAFAYNYDARTQVDNAFRIMNDSMPANTYAPTKIMIPNYANTSVTRKGLLIQSASPSDQTSTWWHSVNVGNVTLSAAINQITLFAESATYPFKAGTSYYLAGWS